MAKPKPDDETLEIYIAEILGDLGKLHEVMKGLKKDVPLLAGVVAAAADSFEARTEIMVQQSAASTRNTTLAIAGGGVVICALLFGGAGYFIRAGADAINLSTAKSKVQEANMRAETAIADAEAKALSEVEELKKVSAWAGTDQGRRAKKFFESGVGDIAAKCNNPSAWDIVTTSEGKFCVPRRRPVFGGEEKKYGWPIP